VGLGAGASVNEGQQRPQIEALRPAIERLAKRSGVPAATVPLAALLETLACDPTAPTSVRDPARALDVHLADSLSGLHLGGLTQARAVADVGSGAGLPGLVLASVLPDTRFDLIEATARKCTFIEGVVGRLSLANAKVICGRAEEWAAGPGREQYDVVTARAVGRLATLLEYAAPLLEAGGRLVAWKGRRDADEEAEGERAAGELGMQSVAVEWVGPFAGSRNRHLYVFEKVGETPPRFPRRPGMAAKRPLGRSSSP
jgi:16S rRNA (guanine527-N7)-methyltransferase